jgi:hypothetical protein
MPNRGSQLIPRHENTPDLEESSIRLRNLIASKFPASSRIWFHVDEHAKMCERGEASGANFTRGALGVLTLTEYACIVIATFVERPNIDPDKSSVVCRYPSSRHQSNYS